VSEPTALRTVGRAHAGRDIAAQMILRGANLVLGVFVTLLTVRTLGDEGFGQWSTLMAVIGFAGYFGSMGLDRVTVERAAADPDREALWVGALVTLRLALGVPVAALSAILCAIVADDAAMRIAGTLVSIVLLVSAASAIRVVFQLQVRNRLVTLVELVSGVVWAGVVAVVALAGGGLVAFAFGFMLMQSATNLVYVALALRHADVRFRGTRHLWGRLAKLGVPVGIAGLLTLGYGYIDQVIVFTMAGASDAGLYGAVYRMLERLQFIPATLLTTLFPVLVAARDHDRERLVRVLQITVEYLAMASLPALAISLAGPEAIVRLLFGDDFAAAAPAMPILMAAFGVICFGYLTGHLVIAYELQRQFVLIALAGLVFNASLNLLLVPRYGFLAAAWLTLATEVLVTALAAWIVVRKAHVWPHAGRLWRVLIAAVACWGAGALLHYAVGAPTLVWATAAAAVYAGALLALRAIELSDLRGLLRRDVAITADGPAAP
jgi:O-antigen/teichoic acid export membrane protein